MAELGDLTKAVEALETEAADGVDAALIGRMATTRNAITERRNTAQSQKELRACNALLDRLRSVYAP